MSSIAVEWFRFRFGLISSHSLNDSDEREFCSFPTDKTGNVPRSLAEHTVVAYTYVNLEDNSASLRGN